MKKILLFLSFLLISIGIHAIAINDVLILENFTGGNSQTDWSKISSTYSNTYSDVTMQVSEDASVLTFGASNAKVSTSSASNMDGSHVWLNKNTTGYVEINNITLHNVTKF